MSDNASSIARAPGNGAGAPKKDDKKPEVQPETIRWLEPEKDVVPIESLFYADQGPHILERGTIPLAPGPNVQVELVSQGDHLRHAAEWLIRLGDGTAAPIDLGKPVVVSPTSVEHGGAPMTGIHGRYGIVAP